MLSMLPPHRPGGEEGVGGEQQASCLVAKQTKFHRSWLVSNNACYVQGCSVERLPGQLMYYCLQ